MRAPLVLDLCAGTGGATRAFALRGCEVVRVELDPELPAEVHADVRQWSWTGPRPLLIWASPPCTEFSRRVMPWLRDKHPEHPDLSIARAVARILFEARPLVWVVENVHGSSRWLNPIFGPVRTQQGPFCLWGTFPRFRQIPRARFPGKERRSSTRRRERAAVPAILSEALAAAVLEDLEIRAHWGAM